MQLNSCWIILPRIPVAALDPGQSLRKKPVSMPAFARILAAAQFRRSPRRGRDYSVAQRPRPVER